jgi:hypothetical protein
MLDEAKPEAVIVLHRFVALKFLPPEVARGGPGPPNYAEIRVRRSFNGTE